MRKIILASISLFILLLQGCQLASTKSNNFQSPQSTKTPLEELQAYMFNIGEDYCRVSGAMTSFWEDYHSDQYKVYIENDGNDVSLMRVLGKKYNDQLLITNTANLINQLEQNKFSRNPTLNESLTEISC